MSSFAIHLFTLLCRPWSSPVSINSCGAQTALTRCVFRVTLAAVQDSAVLQLLVRLPLCAGDVDSHGTICPAADVRPRALDGPSVGLHFLCFSGMLNTWPINTTSPPGALVLLAWWWPGAGDQLLVLCHQPTPPPVHITVGWLSC